MASAAGAVPVGRAHVRDLRAVSPHEVNIVGSKVVFRFDPTMFVVRLRSMSIEAAVFSFEQNSFSLFTSFLAHPHDPAM